MAEGNGEVSQVDSAIWGVSVRGWLASILVLTVCIANLLHVGALLYSALKSNTLPTDLSIGEPLYSMSVAALGFYFGQKKAQ